MISFTTFSYKQSLDLLFFLYITLIQFNHTLQCILHIFFLPWFLFANTGDPTLFDTNVSIKKSVMRLHKCNNNCICGDVTSYRKNKVIE